MFSFEKGLKKATSFEMKKWLKVKKRNIQILRATEAKRQLCIKCS